MYKKIMEKITLLKFLVASKIGSRRFCFNAIKDKEIRINDQVKTDPLYVLKSNDLVFYQDQQIKHDPSAFEKVYIMMNKPKGYICSLQDHESKPSIMKLIHHKNLNRLHLFPVGRLDFLTEGLIFITNDGDFTNYITHPRYTVLKEYYVEIKGKIIEQNIKRMKKGFYTEEGVYRVEKVDIISTHEKESRMILTLNEGKNREIRNIFAILKHKIKKLQRIKIGPITLDKHLKPGEYKLLPKKVIHHAFKIDQG